MRFFFARTLEKVRQKSMVGRNLVFFDLSLGEKSMRWLIVSVVLVTVCLAVGGSVQAQPPVVVMGPGAPQPLTVIYQPSHVFHYGSYFPVYRGPAVITGFYYDPYLPLPQYGYTLPVYSIPVPPPPRYRYYYYSYGHYDY